MERGAGNTLKTHDRENEDELSLIKGETRDPEATSTVVVGCFHWQSDLVSFVGLLTFKSAHYKLVWFKG